MPTALLRRLAALLVLPLGSLSCGADASPPGEGDQDLCRPPNRLLEDGSCLAPGVQDNGCPAGELGLEDGSCQPAGVPPALCADGFEPLGQGCEPILPPEPCEPGLMAVPGDSACREVAPCGQGRWGDIPIDGSTQHVDAAYGGGDSDGTADRPWTTIGEAVTAAAPGALVAIAAGSYAENIEIADKPVTLWGLCPGAVEVVGSATALVGTVHIRNGADGTQVRNLAVRGDSVGLFLSSTQDVVLDRLWVHDNASRGINVQDTVGPTGITISGTLIEQNHELGVFVSGSDASIEGTVVRATLPQAPDQTFSQGIAIQTDSDTAKRASVMLRASLVEQNHQLGVLVSGSDATIEGTVVRTTLPRASDQTAGQGIAIQNTPYTAERASVTLRASLVEQNHQTGVLVVGSDATIEGAVVRATLPKAADQAFGRGIGIELDPDASERASVTLRASLVEQNHELGVFVLGSDVTIEGTVVRTTLPRVSDQTAGQGIAIQDHPQTAERASVTLRASLVEHNHELGIYLLGSDAIIEGTVVRTTLAQASNDLFGDGIVIVVPANPASALISSCLVESSARAGLAVFGATARLAATALECNVIDLDAESLNGVAGTFEDLGYNRCGCGSESAVCHAVSTGLEPPPPVE